MRVIKRSQAQWMKKAKIKDRVSDNIRFCDTAEAPPFWMTPSFTEGRALSLPTKIKDKHLLD